MKKNIVFLHGFCETKEMWNDFQEELSKDHNVYCLDLPGFGDFNFDVTDLEISDIAQIISNEIKKLAIEKYVLIGHSLGGYVALEILKNNPNGISGLGLINSTVFADSDERKNKRNDVISFIEKHGSAKFVKSFVPQLFIASKREECKTEIQNLISNGKDIFEKTLIETTKAMQIRNDNREVIISAKIPIQFIVGKNDKSVLYEDSLQQAAMPKVSIVTILDDCGHMAMFEQREITFKSIQHLLSLIK